MVTTIEQAAQLNADGTTQPYRAMNGHLMIARLRWPSEDGPCGNCGGTGRIEDGQYVCGFCKGRGSGAPREYRVGDRVNSESWSAWCAPGCGACAEGEDLPDW